VKTIFIYSRILHISDEWFIKNKILQILDSASLTACLDIVFWLFSLDGLQKLVLFLTNFSYNFQTNKQDTTIVTIYNYGLLSG